uniref:Uncharacterized protein n=1 Tax=viral metagenome TaxID=1070528 RepID=A0A6C0F410_9ZZZZ
MSQRFETKINKYTTSEDSFEDGWDFYIYLDADYERENYNCSKTSSTDIFDDDYNNENCADDADANPDDKNNNNNCRKFNKRILLYLFTGCLFTSCLFSACISAYFYGFTHEKRQDILSFGGNN